MRQTKIALRESFLSIRPKCAHYVGRMPIYRGNVLNAKVIKSFIATNTNKEINLIETINRN